MFRSERRGEFILTDSEPMGVFQGPRMIRGAAPEGITALADTSMGQIIAIVHADGRPMQRIAASARARPLSTVLIQLQGHAGTPTRSPARNDSI